ncbi:hypothetical protein TL16_g12525 [Triparma laevis f. inornata]|uniref:Uncharacterized protein n=2 Tax=Triparma laevis TaxID=1534972 RepID=A0A9W7AXK8_9STRA|nr:hypothetical protein TrLO_g5090 [Triparma laevis f. longispina]GMH93060.1 hypothetical protein TL16_g12525 [Triparma laevis f. inornata]
MPSPSATLLTSPTSNFKTWASASLAQAKNEGEENLVKTAIADKLNSLKDSSTPVEDWNWKDEEPITLFDRADVAKPVLDNHDELISLSSKCRSAALRILSRKLNRRSLTSAFSTLKHHNIKAVDFEALISEERESRLMFEGRVLSMIFSLEEVRRHAKLYLVLETQF